MVTSTIAPVVPRTIPAAIIAPRKYVQGRGILSIAGEYLAELGKNALVIASPSVWKAAGHILEQTLNANNIAYTQVLFKGTCSENEVQRLVAEGKAAGVDVIVGVGGGSCLDTAKSVGYRLKVNWAVLPSLASTDAPTSALSVIYSDDGVFERYEFQPKNPDLVLVDTEIIAHAPVRFLTAGIGDALSTWIEARASLEARSKAMSGGLATLAGAQLAKLCYETLFTYSIEALRAVEHQAVTPAVEKIVEANTLLSGLGFESGGLAAAHAIHNGLTELEQTHSRMHGEKVAFGTLTQLVLEGRPTDEILEVTEFCLQVGLPTTLADLGLENVSREDLLRVAERACVPDETIHNLPFVVTPDMVVDAMISIDALAKDYKSQRA